MSYGNWTLQVKEVENGNRVSREGLSFVTHTLPPPPYLIYALQQVYILTEYEVLGHVVLICTNDMVLLPISYFSHKAPSFLAFSMLLFGELGFYFFLTLSFPSYAATLFYSFILLMMTTGVASTFHHHTQQKRPLWAGFLCAEMQVKWEWWVASMTVWSKASRCRHPWCFETTARTSYGWNEEREGQLEAEDKEVAAGPCRP